MPYFLLPKEQDPFWLTVALAVCKRLVPFLALCTKVHFANGKPCHSIRVCSGTKWKDVQEMFSSGGIHGP